ncbi:unnamed protein product [Nesidiocoris tenuis]|uniref:Uncharacterized protein n=1 Tax=Nesidiocoris tenuis TaxID=355587 RepID=A0A6H5GTJ7_9HEMI|nr:unnamed protein product [Nesidiocoris tenuis]
MVRGPQGFRGSCSSTPLRTTALVRSAPGRKTILHNLRAIDFSYYITASMKRWNDYSSSPRMKSASVKESTAFFIREGNKKSLSNESLVSRINGNFLYARIYQAYLRKRTYPTSPEARPARHSNKTLLGRAGLTSVAQDQRVIVRFRAGNSFDYFSDSPSVLIYYCQ